MHILALNPYRGGSHAAVLDGWRGHSRHRFTELALDAHHWKWRMRHAAWTLAQRARQVAEPVDLVWATDMLDLAAWRGLCPAHAATPAVCYQHETQLLYPDRRRRERDDHFAFSNLLGAAAADAVWWNSAWHRDAATAAWRAWLRRMPDHRPVDAVDRIAARSRILTPGIVPIARAPGAGRGPPLVLWCARWAEDKDPETFATAVHRLADRGLAFRLALIGGRDDTGRYPALARLRAAHADRIVAWGWLAERTAYRACLAAADIVVSTARHEFFGLAVLEAVSAGAWPLLPDRLAYPEIYGPLGRDAFYGDGALEDRLAELIAAPPRRDPAPLARARAWSRQAPHWDAAAEACARRD